jgi:phosphoesterase RecJ-like protein
MAYASNTTIHDLAQRLRAARSVVVLTHAKPDGDALGSTLALVRSLNHNWPKELPPKAQAWYVPPMPPWAKDIIGTTPARVLGASLGGPDGPPPHVDPDMVVVCDTGSWTQLEHVREWIESRSGVVACVDHHVQGDADVASLRVIDTAASAAAQPVGELCRAILGLASLDQLPADVAEALYVGLASDTGWFKHSNVTPAVFDEAASLLRAGARHTALFRSIEQRQKASRLRLLARALSTLELHENGRVALMTLTLADIAATGAEPGDSGGFVDHAGMIEGVEVVALLTEAWEPTPHGTSPKPATKISFRSKAGERFIDVNLVARTLGGGGHVHAAGARPSLSIEQTRLAVLAALAPHVAALSASA